MPGSPPPSPSKYNLLDPELSSPFGGADEVFYCLRQAHKLHKNKMDSNFNKSRQCSLKRSHIALTEINPELIPSSFSTKTDSYRSTNHRNLQKQSNEDFFIQLLYAWLHLTNNIRSPYL